MTDSIVLQDNGVTLRIENLARTQRALSKAGADMQDMKDLMHEVGMIVVHAANVPVLTGATAGSVRAGRGKTKAVVRAGGAKAKHAPIVHYGWPAHGIEKNPFLVEALQAKRADVFTALDKGIDDIKRKNDLI